MPAGIGHRTRDRDKHREQSFMRRAASEAIPAEERIRGRRYGTGQPRAPFIEAVRPSTMGRMMPVGVCVGCREERHLPPFGEGMCFICATDGPPGDRTSTGGSLGEHGDGRMAYDFLTEEEEERRQDVLDIFSDAQNVYSSSVRADAIAAQKFDRTVRARAKLREGLTSYEQRELEEREERRASQKQQVAMRREVRGRLRAERQDRDRRWLANHCALDRLRELRQERVRSLQGLSDPIKAGTAPTRAKLGRPRAYGPDIERRVADLIAEGLTHREVAASLRIPTASIGNIAKRVGARRTIGCMRGGMRVKGSVLPARPHRRLPKEIPSLDVALLSRPLSGLLETWSQQECDGSSHSEPSDE